jgi:hypothetical protein
MNFKLIALFSFLILASYGVSADCNVKQIRKIEFNLAKGMNLDSLGQDLQNLVYQTKESSDDCTAAIKKINKFLPSLMNRILPDCEARFLLYFAAGKFTYYCCHILPEYVD